MENLQRLAINYFIGALKNAPPPLVRIAVNEVYSVRPSFGENQLEDGGASSERPWTVVGFDDMREKHADFNGHFVKGQKQGLSPNEPRVEV
ncbi:hypothetical protein N7540_011325 [Penicillium herquei]|nr:hypothetical protein N7540_011325 [Penicillium herquei]